MEYSDSPAASVDVGIITKCIVFIVIFFMFLCIAAYTLSVFKTVAPFLTEHCYRGSMQEPVYVAHRAVHSRESAQAVLQSYLPLDATFVTNSFENCGVAYIFKDLEENEYLVCENGKVYLYGLICD